MFEKIELRHGKSNVFFIGTVNNKRALFIRDSHLIIVKKALTKARIDNFVSKHLPEKSLIENPKAHKFFIEEYENEFGSIQNRFFVSCKKFDFTDIEHTFYLFDVLDSVGFNRENKSYYVRKFVPDLVEIKSSARPYNPFGSIMLMDGNSKFEKMLSALGNEKTIVIDAIDLEKVESFVGCRVAIAIRMKDGEEKVYGDSTCLKHISENYSRLNTACDLDRYRTLRSDLSPYF
jgi:hypothetical protein